MVRVSAAAEQGYTYKRLSIVWTKGSHGHCEGSSCTHLARRHRLACQVASGPFAGLYELPGGKIESGESAEKACRREVEEELRCELSTLWPLDHVSYDYPDFHLSMEVFACELASGSEPQATEHSELRWLSRQELVEVQWLPADAQLMSLVATYWRDLRGDH